MRQKNSIISPTKVEHRAGAVTMSRIVQCPKCRVLLQEPPPGNPYYQCGSCSTTLQAKHATKADLESTNVRFTHHHQHVEKQNSKGSKSDSSSEDISERVGDDHGCRGDGSPSWSPHRKNGPVGPMYGGIRAGAAPGHFRSPSDDTKAEMQHPDRGFKTSVAANHHHQQPSPQAMNYDMGVDRTQQSAYGGGAEYGPRRGGAASAGERYSSPSSLQEASSYGSSGFHSNPSRPQAMQSPGTGATTNRANSGRGDGESEALRAHQPGASSITHHHHHHQQHSGQPTLTSPLEQQQQVNSPSLKPAAAAGTGEPASSTSTGATLTSSSSASSSGRTSKLLKWQPRPETVENQAVSSPRAVEVVMSSRGIVDDDRITSGLPHEDRGNETTTSVDYVPERNWRELQSRRRGKHEDNRVRGDAQQQQQHIQRTQSDGSEKNFDMYDSPSASAYGAGPGPDYEASETSSTMDEGEGNDGGANVGRLSPPPALHLPDLRGGIPKSLSRPNLPRSNASSGRLSSYSEDGNSHATKMLAEIDSLDNAHPQVDNFNRTNRRQHSWDATRMGAPSGSSNTNSPVPGTETGLRKSSSDDCVNMITEPHEHAVHSRVSSDPTTAGALYQQVDQQQHHNQWVARLKQQPQPPRTGANFAVSSPMASPSGVGNPRPPTHVQWDRSSSGSNLQTPYVEQNLLPPSQLNSFHPPPAGAAPQLPPSNQSSRPMPDSPTGPGGSGGQLPPKQANYPPLPPPGALPHVSCRHCRTLLAVPVNLPPPRKSTQKLRCGACMKISTFSVSFPQHSVEPSYTSSRSDVQYGQLFASSPDAHESSSSNPGYRTTSGRSLSATEDELRRSGRRYSDLSDKSLPMTRNNSLGSADMPSDEELAERIRVMKIDSHSFSNPAISTTSESPHPSSFSDGHSPSASEYKSRFSRGASAGPLYPRRGLSSFDHGPGSAPSGRQQTEERSRFAADQRPSSRRHEEGVTSSDSESEHHQTLSHGSPQIDSHGHQHRYSHSGSRSPPQHPHHQSPPMPASSSHGEHSGKDHAHHEPSRGFNKALKGIIHIKTSLRDLTHRGHKDQTNHVRSKVSVNGVPIPDNVLKKAEDHAGKILPGSYWYDEHAGFWGVQGGQCEGIIPPYIEEFHYPMSTDCAGGRTGILVNGRELHSVDLEILSKRGLPNIPGRAYRIDIDGKVINQATGEELKGLGRLAPTLELTRRGGGMHPTR